MKNFPEISGPCKKRISDIQKYLEIIVIYCYDGDMVKEIPTFETIKFPTPTATMLKLTPEFLVNQLLDVQQRYENFYYREVHDNNDLREAHLQFMSDASQFKEWLKEVTADILEIYKVYDEMKKDVQQLKKVAHEYVKRITVARITAGQYNIDLLDPVKQQRQLHKEIEEQSNELLRRKKNMDEIKDEITITEAMLQKKKTEMQLALQHRYTLTPSQKRTLIEEKDMILDGVETWGTISGALKHNKQITSKASTIMMYCQQFPEFGEAIEISKSLFKDKIDGTVIERALEGTENPQFYKGEHMGDYKIKNDKLLVELAKAKIPEQYNKKSTDNSKHQQINNISITSFANINETDLGFKKDVGVVLDVDDTGAVKRITTDEEAAKKAELEEQEKKMVDFYKKKEGAVIITGEKEES